MLPAASHPMPSLDREQLAFVPKDITSTTPYSQGFQALLSAQPTPLRESLGVGPINAALKRLKLPTVTPGATLVLSTSLFLYRFSGAFYSSLTHAINLQTLSHTVLYKTPGSSAAVLQSPVIPNIRRSSAPQSVHCFSLPPGPRFFAPSSSPDVAPLGNLWSPMQSSAPDHNNLLVPTVASILSHPVRWSASM